MTAGDQAVTKSMQTMINGETAMRTDALRNLHDSNQHALENISRKLNSKLDFSTFQISKGNISRLRKDIQDMDSSVEAKIKTQVDNLHINMYATVNALNDKADQSELESKASNQSVHDLGSALSELQRVAASKHDVQGNTLDIQELQLEFSAVNCESIQCGIGGTCSKRNGSRPSCVCSHGFKKDGTSTSPTDPCNDCSELYMKTGDGKFCDLNPCLSNGSVAAFYKKDCGHGTCNRDRMGRCDCDDHYEGASCGVCMPGYRKAYDSCIVDTCYQKSCGHGRCSIHCR